MSPLRPDRAFECDDNRAEVSMLLYGGGISVAPLSNYLKLINGEPAPALACLRIRETLPEAKLGMIRRTGDRLSPAALQFYEQVDRFFSQERAVSRPAYPSQVRFAHQLPPRGEPRGRCLIKRCLSRRGTPRCWRRPACGRT